MKNLPKTVDIDHGSAISCISEIKKLLGYAGRLIVRKSGTEPLTRIMIEAETEKLIAEAEERLNFLLAV
jgi:phosphoglucosamine mutase